MKRIVFLRHSQTAFNLPPVRLRGDMDVPLSSEGFRQIPDIVEKIKVEYPNVRQVYSSPLERTAILAATVAHGYGLKVTKLDGLKSRGYGVLNGKEISEVKDVLTTLGTGAGRDLAPKDGESMNAFLERLTEAIKSIIYNAPEEGIVVVCTHLVNILLGTAWLYSGLPEPIPSFNFRYTEESEVAPGEWIEVRREWIPVKKVEISG
jgi:broad specificity phosphatase PhoE